MNIIESIREYISDLDCMATFKINVNDDTSLSYNIEGNYTRKSLADYLCNKVNELYIEEEIGSE